MVNYEADTGRTRAGLVCIDQKGEAGGSRARGRGPRARRRQRSWRSVVPGTPCSTCRALPQARCFSSPPQAAGRSGLLAQCGSGDCSSPRGRHPRARTAPLPLPRPLLGKRQAEAGPSGLFFAADLRMRRMRAGFGGGAETGAVPGRVENRDSEVRVPRSASHAVSIVPVPQGFGRPASRLEHMPGRRPRRAGEGGAGREI